MAFLDYRWVGVGLTLTGPAYRLAGALATQRASLLAMQWSMGHFFPYTAPSKSVAMARI